MLAADEVSRKLNTNPAGLALTWLIARLRFTSTIAHA